MYVCVSVAVNENEKRWKKLTRLFEWLGAFKTERSKVKYAINEYKYENHKLNSIPESNFLISKIRISVQNVAFIVLCECECRDY